MTSPRAHRVAYSMKHNPSETSAYTPGTPSLPQPIPQEVIPTCKKIDKKCFYRIIKKKIPVKKSMNGILFLEKLFFLQ